MFYYHCLCFLNMKRTVLSSLPAKWLRINLLSARGTWCRVQELTPTTAGIEKIAHDFFYLFSTLPYPMSQLANQKPCLLSWYPAVSNQAWCRQMFGQIWVRGILVPFLYASVAYHGGSFGLALRLRLSKIPLDTRLHQILLICRRSIPKGKDYTNRARGAKSFRFSRRNSIKNCTKLFMLLVQLTLMFKPS